MAETLYVFIVSGFFNISKKYCQNYSFFFITQRNVGLPLVFVYKFSKFATLVALIATRKYRTTH